uniref:Ribosomal protein S14 n=1 Tax=Heterostelium pallidum TaxID=13642 RepID=Q5ILK5_HETPA|nr:ribosomal protein S14 [Heterostelium pallidum]AAU00605.1 ribosomal protein S14 [Heterostelium pallidum]
MRKNRKDNQIREFYKKNEQQRNVYKMLRQNSSLSMKERIFYSDELANIATKGSICKIKNRCIVTGRARGIISEYKISRLQFREFVKLGLITGIRKLSY